MDKELYYIEKFFNVEFKINSKLGIKKAKVERETDRRYYLEGGFPLSKATLENGGRIFAETFEEMVEKRKRYLQSLIETRKKQIKNFEKDIEDYKNLMNTYEKGEN